MSDLRLNQKRYIWFYENIVSAILSKTVYHDVVLKKNHSGEKVAADHRRVIPEAGEAFGLLCLENYWERCHMEEFKEYEGLKLDQVPPKDMVQYTVTNKLRNTRGVTKYKTLYNCSDKPKPGKENRQTSDWNTDGHIRLNQLCQQVKEDREKNGDAFQEVYAEHVMMQYGPNKKRDNDDNEEANKTKKRKSFFTSNLNLYADMIEPV